MRNMFVFYYMRFRWVQRIFKVYNDSTVDIHFNPNFKGISYSNLISFKELKAKIIHLLKILLIIHN